MTDWTECDWSRQLASVIGDQTRIMNDLRAVKESAKKTEKAHSDNYQNLYDGIKELQSQIQMLAIANTPRSAAYEEDGPQGDGDTTRGEGHKAPFTRRPEFVGRTQYGPEDMSFTMQAPPDIETPICGARPVATSTRMQQKSPTDGRPKVNTK